MFIMTNGIKMNYEISGTRGSSVVILSHSLGSSLLMWNPQMETLEPHFQVLRYDTRGHGNSEVTPSPYSLELLGEDAIGLLDALGIDKVYWVGISMGGMIGQCVALNHPHRLAGLVLCDTTAIILPEAQPIWQDRIVGAREKGMESQLQATMERWFNPPFLKQNPPILQLIQKQFLATPVEGYVGCIGAIRRLNFLDRLSEIKIPTLIVVGEDDPGAPVSASEAIKKRIPNSRLIVIRSARHLSSVEQPEEFNTALVEFLKGF